ncbi:MAG: sulfur carrier protein ThiS [Candidatus Latescibacterota bacterium]|nr:MAG: sulfur carrier protein ThiS [Candidatus Latescibacterota bacterium]
MDLIINGEKKDAGNVATLEDLMKRLGYTTESKGLAVAVNDTVIPKSQWKSTTLNAGDSIEVIHAVQGG